ncbi:hypothetical protein SFC55_19765 [Niallia taxi]|uniref:OmpL47-type beta-barrel domain-containing protein n=1 Tax=Niallia taxi TaxID=2499688 RepID=UPI003982CC94
MRGKSIFLKSFLLLTLLVYQLAFPVGAIKAAANETILPPSNLAYQSSSPDDGKLTWSAVYGATGYKVYEIKDGQLTLLGTTSSVNYSVNDLPEGAYRYVVATVTNDGESGPSAPVSTEIIYPDMQTPTNIVSTVKNGNDIVLSWQAATYAEKYNIYITKSGQKSLLTSTTARSYTIEKAEEGAYSYSVSAYNSLYGESPESEPVSVELVHPELKEPENLTFTITNGTDVNLKWQASDYATSYKIYEVKDGQLELLKTVAGTSASFTNLPAGNYIYKVFAFSDRFGESIEGSQAEVEVSSIVMTGPENAAYKIQNTNDVVFSWNTVPYANAYKIYEIVDGEKILKTTVKGTTATLSKLAGGSHEYEIYSYSDRFGESETASKLSFSIETVAVNPPEGLTYKVQNGNDIVLNWSAAENATNYKIYQIIDGEKIVKSTVTGTTVTYTNLAAGSYQFEVHTNSTRFGESENGTLVSIQLDEVKLAAPEELSYELKNGNDAVLTWKQVENAASYKVYQVIDGKRTLKATVSNTTATITNLPEGDNSFEVYAYNSRFGESEKAAVLSIPVIYPKLAPPSELAQTILNPSAFTLSWNQAEYASSYRVYQLINGEKVLKSNVNGTSVTYSNIQPGTYKYEVYSYSSRFGESEEGKVLEVTLSGQVLAAPEDVTYTIANGNDLTLKWKSVQYANGYKIYKLLDGEETLERTVTGTSVTLTNVSEGDFHYVIKAYSNLFGESPVGGEAKDTLNYPEMAQPQNVTKTVTNGNDITLKWNAVTYAKGYNIYQYKDGEKELVRTVTGTSVVFSNMPEGEYLYIIHSFSDRFGESAEGSTAEFNLTWPIMQAPGNLTKTISNGNDITLRWNSVTYAKEYRIYQIAEGEKTLVKKTTGTSASFTDMPEGDYEYVVYSYSDRFGESPEGSTLTFNVVWPIMQAPENLTKTIANGNDIVLKWNASAYAKNYKIYQVIDGEKVLQSTVTGTSVTYKDMAEDDYTFIVQSYSDRFGDSPEESTLTFNLTWPTVQVPVVSGSVFNANNITLSWKAADWANSYKVYEVIEGERKLLYSGTALTYKVYNLSEDTHTFEVTAYSNRFGESLPSESFVQTIVYPVMEAPKASLTLLSETSARITWDFVTYANGYNIYEIINGKPVLLVENLNNLSYELKNLTLANHEYYVTSYSNSFGESKPSETVIAKLIVDTQAPETKSNAPVHWINENFSVLLEAEDDETGVANTYYSLNEGIIQAGTSVYIDQEGVNKLSFNSLDKAGNMEEVKTVYIKLDKTSPVTTISEMPAYAQIVDVQLTSSDSLSGVDKTYYSINGSDYVEGTSFSVEKEGTNEISYYSVDVAGNKEEVKTAQVKIDKSAPATEANIKDGWANKEVAVTLTAKDEMSGVVKTYYSINGSEYAEGTDFTVEKEGTNEISYYSVDTAGNKEEVKTAQVKIDKSAPATEANIKDGWANKEVAVTLTAKDEMSGVVKTYYSISGSEYAEGTDFTVEKEGTNEISYYSVDAAGNKEEVKTAQVKIDKSAPATEANIKDGWANKEVAVTLTAKDEMSGVVKTYYSINGSEYAEGTDFTVEKEGTNEISYYSVDAAGNNEEVQTAEVKIDKSAPDLTIHKQSLYELGTKFALDYDASDDLSGITTEIAVINGKTYKKGDAVQLNEPGEYKISVSLTNGAGLTTVKEETIKVYVPISLEVLPKVIKGNKGTFTVKATLPKKYQSLKFDVSSIRLNGIAPKLDSKGLILQAEKGQFKFDREDFDWESGDVELVLSGYLNNKIYVVGQTTAEAKDCSYKGNCLFGCFFDWLWCIK